jgi:hypothetical protein
VLVPGMRVKGTEDLVPSRDLGAARVKNGDLLEWSLDVAWIPGGFFIFRFGTFLLINFPVPLSRRFHSFGGFVLVQPHASRQDLACPNPLAHAQQARIRAVQEQP